MQPAAGSKRSRAPTDEKGDNEAAATFDATRSNEGRAAQRPRMEGEPQPALPVAGEPAAQSAAAAAVASVSPGRLHSLHASQPTARAGSRSHAAGGAAAADDQLSESQPARATGPQTVAAAAGRPAISPAQRCDQDSLSVVLSCLGTTDFFAAILVCRQWSSARLKHSAWPRLHLPSFIQSLRDDDYGNPDRRRLNVAIRPSDPSHLAALLTPLVVAAAAAGSAAAPASSMWRHVTDAKLSVRSADFSSERRKQTEWGSTLQQLAQLPYLFVLNLQGCTAGGAAVAAFYQAAAARLQALILTGGSAALPNNLPLLSNLRVLVLNQTPVAGGLLALDQLEYLHFHTKPGEWNKQVSSKLAKALRWLSSERLLRSLSVDSFAGDVAAWKWLFRAPVLPPVQPAEAQPAAAAATQSPSASTPSVVIVDLTKPCGLTDVSMTGQLSGPLLASICALPRLTRLQCVTHGVWNDHPLPVDTLAQLQQMRLKWWGNPGGKGSAAMQIGWGHLQHCSQLRVLELSTSSTVHVKAQARATAVELQRTLAVCSNSLEELRLGEAVRLGHDHGSAEAEAAAASQPSAQPAAAAAAAWLPPPHSAVPNGWGVLAQCTRLCVLEIPLQPDTADSGMLEVLSMLPAFQSLELIVCKCGRGAWPASGPRLPPKLLQHITRSRSWCSLHIRAVTGKRAADVLSADGGLAAQMPVEEADEATTSRLRVYDHKAGAETVLSYAIRADERGAKNWEQV